MDEVRRDDGELCGYVTELDGHWLALTVFGATLAEYDTEHDARRHVAAEGLAALADRWTLVDGVSGVEEVVCIQQASPTEVSLALGYYSLPGVPDRTIPVDELTSGRWRLERRH
jgi:hypothetical protein